RRATPVAITMSPSSRLAALASRSATNDSTSVGASVRRYWRLSWRTRRSVTSATPTSPRTREGATAASHRASPPSRTGRPRPSDTITRKRLLAGSTVRFVRLHDLLHERMAHDILVVEVHERDALDLADDLHGLDQARRARRGQVDLGDVSRDDGLRAEAEAGQ